MTLKQRVAAAAAGREYAHRARVDRIESQVAHYRRRLLDNVELAELAPLDETQRRARLERLLGELLSTEGPVLSNATRSLLIRRVVDEALGLGILEPLLSDESVTEIMVNGPGEIFVERAGRIERVESRFDDDAQVFQAIDRIVSAVNRRVDESSPMVDARLPTGERVNVIIPPLALAGPTMTIRRFPRSYSLDQLVTNGSLDEDMAALIRALVRARLSVVVSGGTGSGKTTMLNAVSAHIPDGERIVTVEQTAELQLTKEHVIRLESRPANVEGGGEVSIRDLVRNSLRMRPDRIIVGEVRGGETLDMLQAMNTGHEGSLTTVHANTADDALLRLATLATMTELDLPFETVQEQINSAVDIIIHVERAFDGSRRMVEIAHLVSGRREPFKLVTLSRFQREPMRADRRLHGRHRHFPLPAALADRLALAGEAAPAAFAGGGDADEAPQREAL